MSASPTPKTCKYPGCEQPPRPPAAETGRHPAYCELHDRQGRFKADKARTLEEKLRATGRTEPASDRGVSLASARLRVVTAAMEKLLASHQEAVDAQIVAALNALDDVGDAVLAEAEVAKVRLDADAEVEAAHERQRAAEAAAAAAEAAATAAIEREQLALQQATEATARAQDATVAAEAALQAAASAEAALDEARQSLAGEAALRKASEAEALVARSAETAAEDRALAAEERVAEMQAQMNAWIADLVRGARWETTAELPKA